MPSTQLKTVIRADRLIHPEAQDAVQDQHILVEDGRICGLISRGNIPDGARLIDLPDCTVLPGLIDCHTHLTLPAEFSEILDELRRRAGERFRPSIELDYIERLLKRF